MKTRMNDLKAVAPTRNTLVVNDQKERHLVTTVSSQAMFPRVTFKSGARELDFLKQNRLM